MKKILLKLTLLLISPAALLAQTKTEIQYNKRALEIQEEIWNNQDKAFDVKETPERYKNESAVIIAKSYTASASRHRNSYNFRAGFRVEFNFVSVLRERVLINDKAALEEFSKLSYTKILDKTERRFLSNTQLNTVTTFIGAKIYKRSGKIVTLNPSQEEVLLKDTKSVKEGRIAIPDLQVGDILDFYIQTEEAYEEFSKFYSDVQGPFLHFLRDEYPVMFLKIRYVLDEKCGADLLNVNGARPMLQTSNKEKDIILESVETNLPKLNQTLWAAPARQTPYYLIRYGFEGTGCLAKTGEVKTGPLLPQIKKNLFTRLYYYPRYFEMAPKAKEATYAHFGGKKAIEKANKDSIVRFLYNYWRLYYNYDPDSLVYQHDQIYNSEGMSLFFKSLGIDNKIMIVTKRLEKGLNDVFFESDIEVFLRVNIDGKITWLTFQDYLHDAGQLPKEYEGQEARMLTYKEKRYDFHFDEGEIVTLPVSKSDENKISEQLTISFNKDDMQQLTVVRDVSETGRLRQDHQKKSLSQMEIKEELRLLTGYSTAETKADLQTHLQKRPLNVKTFFLAEIREQFGQEADSLLSYKVIDRGFSGDTPVFQFTESFVMANFVKKAGSNYLLEVGKLMGEYKKPDPVDRIRSVDIMMPCAREFHYTFNINIPEGYNVKGIETLNKKTVNDIGSFESSATRLGNSILVKVKRIYKNNAEPSVNWPKLLEVMDSSADFANLKILLERTK